jgi:exportin-5
MANNSDNAVEIDQQSAPLVRMQSFITTIHDNCYHMLGSGCHTIGRDFYQLSGLATALLNSVFSYMEVSFTL